MSEDCFLRARCPATLTMKQEARGGWGGCGRIDLALFFPKI